MQRFYPGTQILTASLLLFTLPVLVAEAADSNPQTIAKGVSAEFVEQNLLSHKTVYLRQMKESPEKREEYVKSLYANQKLERELAKHDLDQSQHLLETLRNSRNRILLDTLVNYEFQQIDEDLNALARERYDASPEIFRVRKKIKIALIYIQKHEGKKEEARALMEDIVAQLNANPKSDKLFYELAEKYSDDKMADQGGVNKKWLVAPLDLEKSLPILQASFALDTPKQMTDVVESEYGYSVVRLLKVTPASQLSFGESRSGIKKKIMGQLQYRKKAEVMTSLLAPEDLEFDDEAVVKMVSSLFDTRVAEAEALKK